MPEDARDGRPCHLGADRPRLLGGSRSDSGGPVVPRPGGRLEYPPPVADWLAFLAELLAAEFIREHTPGGNAT